MTKTISFVIPVYRNEGSILPTYNKIKELFIDTKKKYQFVFINDGSDDNSLNELQSVFISDKSNIKVISFSRNFGQVSAVIAGFKEVSGDAVIMMSADLQEPIELIGQMIQKWESGSEIVICNRIDREDSYLANLTSSFFYKLMKSVNPKMPRGGFDFLLLDRKALDVFNSIDERNRFIQGDILWLGFALTFIPYKRLKRTIGKSQWTLKKKMKYFIDGFLTTSYTPIRIMSLIGLITAFGGFLYALVILYYKLFKDLPFDGWAPIMILILIIGGLIMLMLGIIGEYIWRTYDETRKRPIYIIKEKYENK
jgi:glycosyltransferase involved in cell wall biosynthesis